jgi:hypothetical protein
MVFRFGLLIGILSFLVPPQLSAQGIFEGFSIPRTVIATGHTELLAPINVMLRTGTTMSDTLMIDVSPLIITNGSAADIRVLAGGMTAGPAIIEQSAGLVKIPVSAGGTSGTLRVDGVRVSLPGTGASSITARLSWFSGRNLFRDPASGTLTNSASLLVVNRVESGLTADEMTDRFFIFNSRVYDDTAKIVLREGFASAFVSSADYGQNTPTQIRIRASDLPEGLTMHFPATVTATETASTLTTVEGSAIDIPRSSGGKTVVYNFSGAPDSEGTPESFTIPFTVTVSELAESTQPTIEVSLSPVGVLDSSVIPRFAEDNVTVLAGSSRIITKTLYWTGLGATTDNRITVFNPSSTAANLIFTGLDAAGKVVSASNLTNSVRQSIPSSQTIEQSIAQLFGGTASSIATVRIQSTNSAVLAMGTSSNGAVLESTPLAVQPMAAFAVPVSRENTRLHVFNPGPGTVAGTLRLLTSQGRLIKSADLILAPLAAVSPSLEELFATQTDGQVVGSFASSVIVFESFGNSSELNLLQARPSPGVESLYVPFVSVGGGYETEINLINSSDETVTVSAQLFDAQGVRIQSVVPITMAPSDQVAKTVRELFSVQNVSSGYVRIQVPQFSRGFWRFYPDITGHARIRTAQGGSTVVAISNYALQDAFLLNSGNSAGKFQGIAIVNPNSTAVNITLQALSANGTVANTATFSLRAGEISSKLLSEHFTGNVAEGSVVRVTGSAPIIATSVTGSIGGESLRAIPALK